MYRFPEGFHRTVRAQHTVSFTPAGVNMLVMGGTVKKFKEA